MLLLPEICSLLKFYSETSDRVREKEIWNVKNALVKDLRHYYEDISCCFDNTLFLGW